MSIVREIWTKWGFKVDDKSLKGFNKKLQMSKKLMTQVSKATGVMVAGMLIPAAQLERTIGQALTIARRPIEEFQKNRDKLVSLAMDISDELSMSANKVATSYYQVLSTGALITQQRFEELARTGLKFAKVGVLEMADAIEILDGTLKAFNLDGTQSGRVADVMQKTSFLAATNIAQLSEAMKNAAPVAAGLGVSIEETSAVIAGMAEKGIKGGEAGNALKRILGRIKKDTGPAAEALRELNMSVFDGEGNFIGLINMLEKLQEKTKDMTMEKRSKTLMKLAGIYGEAPLLGLLQQDMSKFKDWEKQLLDSTGAVDAGLEQLQETGLETAKGVMHAGVNLATVFGVQLLDALKAPMKYVRDLLIGLRKMADAHKGLAKVVSVVIGLTFAVSTLGLAAISAAGAFTMLAGSQFAAFAYVMGVTALVLASALILYAVFEDIVGLFQGKNSLSRLFFKDIVFWMDHFTRSLKTAWLEFKLWLIASFEDTFGVKLSGIAKKGISDALDAVASTAKIALRHTPVGIAAGLYDKGIRGIAGFGDEQRTKFVNENRGAIKNTPGIGGGTGHFTPQPIISVPITMETPAGENPETTGKKIGHAAGAVLTTIIQKADSSLITKVQR